ncbi:MAG: hypothetical protein IPO67_22990 [Deltaproteobacteria bacterium]|nr:hypothetical protein [Deltaproteobacteria bacterium]MBK9647987.1 hypothetical protein [Deltaproteobacteria bacterium]
MILRISIAKTRAEVLRCQYFIAEIYNRHYQIMFSEDGHDLDARIEPYPQKYLMGTVDGLLVCAFGLYTRNTYVERYGGLTDEEVLGQLEEAGVADRYVGATRRELTKLVVRDGWESFGLARMILNAAHSRMFCEGDWDGDGRPVLLLICGKVSIIERFWAPKGPVRARYLAPFPRYPVHSEYRSEKDPMQSRLIIPDVDIPAALRELTLPVELEITARAPKVGG